MSLETALRARLLADAGIAALVVARVYPVVLPQAPAFPAITYEGVAETRLNTFGGPLGLAGPLMRLHAWASTYDGARDLARKVRLALDGWRGTQSGETVQAVKLQQQVDLYDDETQMHRVAMDFRVWWNES